MTTPATRSPTAARSPTVLRSLSSAVLLDRGGDVELTRESRGAPMEWGGVYGQHVRLTGAWRLTVEIGGTLYTLPATRATATVDGDRYRSEHACGPVEVVQEIVPLSTPPGTLRTLSLRTTGAAPTPVVVTSALEPYLLPVLVEGIRPISVDAETRGEELRVRHRGFALAFRSDPLPSRLYADRASWRGGHRRGRLTELGSDHEVRLAPGRPAELRFAVIGGLERELGRAAGGHLDPLATSAAALGARLEGEDRAWIASTPRLSLPDAPELEIAYEQARAGLRRLYSSPGDGLTGLVAGYPWYSAIWCRDLAWMLPAVLWLGDLSWAERSIDAVLRFQATADLPLLGAETGELAMQISPGPVFLYGTSDTTLYFPLLIERALRHAGGGSAVPAWSAAVHRAIAWGERRSDPATGLVRNGGEVEGLERSVAGLARVRYGIDAPDTTIWDSTDRRDHAIDIQVLWSLALRAAASLDRATGAPTPDAERWDALAAQVGEAIRSRYGWAAERYLCDSIRGGVPVRRLRPNALRAVSAGLFAPELARAVVRRAAEDDLTTPWGVRTLSARDPGYGPTAYHDGQVWTIATAWAADAAFAADEPELGLRYLRTIAERYRTEGGYANECYRGDRDQPFNSCFLLGFSVGPFLTVLFERLWGLSVDARGPALTVRPAFPPAWRSAGLDGLRLGNGTVGLRYDGNGIDVRWSGPGPLAVRGPLDRIGVEAGATGRLRTR